MEDDGKNVEIVAGSPAAFTCEEQASFINLVRQGGEVGNSVLEENITNAKSLVFLRRDGQDIGIAALKCPKLNYRKRISEKAKAEIADATFPYELGYIFVVPAERGKRWSPRLVAKALEFAPDSGVFATARTDNCAMRATLREAGFEPVGEPYKGRESRTLQVFVRTARQEGQLGSPLTAPAQGCTGSAAP